MDRNVTNAVKSGNDSRSSRVGKAPKISGFTGRSVSNVMNIFLKGPSDMYFH